MLAGTLYAVLAAAAMIGWNVMVTEKGRACRPHRRHRAHRRRRRASVGSRNQHSSDRSAEKTTIDVNTNTNPPLPRNKDEGEGEEEEEQKHCCGPARRPCAISTTTPTSADRCPVSPAIGPGGGGLSPGLSPPAVFNDLVLILDAPALPPPPWKLPNLPEEIDISCSTDNMTLDDPALSPSKECDLGPGFHLSAPWSPPARRGSFRHDRRSSPLGNRPRTFSEYSAGPFSSSSSPPPPPLHERCSSAGAGPSSVMWGAEEGGGGGGGGRMGDGRGGRRTRSFTCGSTDRHPFAGLSDHRREEDSAAGNDNGGGGGGRGAAASCTPSSSSSKVGGDGDDGGGIINGSSLDRPRSPLYPRHHSSQVLPVS